MSYCKRSEKAAYHLSSALSVPGDVIEMGVFEGQTTIAMANVLKRVESSKRIYACDTYAGLPYDGIEDIDDMLKAGECTASFEKFWNNIVDAGVEDYVIPVPGLVEETLYSKLADKEFCFGFLDMDLYKPTSFATRYFLPRLNLGGIVGYHDYKFERCPGIEIVVDKEIDRERYKMFDNHVANCAWLQRVL